MLIILLTFLLIFNLTNSVLLRFIVVTEGQFFEYKKINCDNHFVQNTDLHSYFPDGFHRTCPSWSESGCVNYQWMFLRLFYRIPNVQPVEYLSVPFQCPRQNPPNNNRISLIYNLQIFVDENIILQVNCNFGGDHLYNDQQLLLFNMFNNMQIQSENINQAIINLHNLENYHHHPNNNPFVNNLGPLQGQLNLILEQLNHGTNLLQLMLQQIEQQGHNFYHQIALGNLNWQLLFENYQWLNNFYLNNNYLLNYLHALGNELQAIIIQGNQLLEQGNHLINQNLHQQNQQQNQG
uniref:Transmembrane protein n=1 Tax=Meloidogyne hapla TaxID=6305 RepID=A0A1I8B6Y7_MELHA